MDQTNDKLISKIDSKHRLICKPGYIYVCQETLVNLAKILCSDTHLIEIDFCGALLRYMDIFYEFIDALYTNKCLKKLNLGGCGISTEKANYVFEMLCVNNSIQNLCMNHNNINIDSSNKISKMLQTNSSLQELDLSFNDIGTGTVEIFLALCTNDCLRKLNLSCTKITEKEAGQISETLRVNTSLQILNLSGNNVGIGGITAIADALCINISLLKLNLSANYIRKEGAIILADMLRNNNTLLTLKLNNNNICNEGTIEIAKALLINQSLRKLCLVSFVINKIERYNNFANILESNYTLTEFYSSSNSSKLSKILERNRNIFNNSRFKKTKIAAV